jgi:hypothetical protein
VGVITPNVLLIGEVNGSKTRSEDNELKGGEERKEGKKERRLKDR